MKIIAKIFGQILIIIAWILTAVQAKWIGTQPIPKTRVYFANHTSNADFVLIWTALPSYIRKRTRPVAGADYWLQNRFREFIVRQVINAILIDRRAEMRVEDPIKQMTDALAEGSSIIIFPEGKRNMGEDKLLPLKAGIYNIAIERPETEFVPVWIDNISSVLPKGEVLPVPLQCSVGFGTPLYLKEGESLEAFLGRAQEAMLAISGDENDR